MQPEQEQDLFKEFFKDFLAFQKAKPTIKLNGTAKVSGTNAKGERYQYEYKFATLDEILKQCIPILNENNFIVYWETKKTGAVNCVLQHITGETRTATLLIESDPKDPKKKGAAITYARRYTISALLAITTETDSDAPPEEGNPKKALTKKSITDIETRIAKGDAGVINTALRWFEVPKGLLDKWKEMEDFIKEDINQDPG